MSTTDAPTNPHLAEVAHDRKLLDLLWATHVADAKVAGLWASAKGNAVAYRASWRRTSQYETVTVGGMPGDIVTYEDLPIGAIYQSEERAARGRGTVKVIRVRSDHAADDAFRSTPIFDPQVSRDEVLAALQAKAEATPTGYYDRNQPERMATLISSLIEAEQAARVAREVVAVHERDYTGWSRFWLVTSSAGHVHSSTSCSTCYSTTGFAPYPDLAACDEVEAVAILGETLCSVCFPSAPVEYTTGKKITKAVAKKLTGHDWSTD